MRAGTLLSAIINPGRKFPAAFYCHLPFYAEHYGYRTFCLNHSGNQTTGNDDGLLFRFAVFHAQRFYIPHRQHAGNCAMAYVFQSA